MTKILSRIISSGKKIISHPYFPVLVLIVLDICLGSFIVSDYGESWDEANNKTYAEQSIEAYAWWSNREIELSDYLGPTDQRYRGPAYPMLASLLVSSIHTIDGDWPPIDLWHFSNFLFFQLGVFFIYMICLRYIKTWAAFGATLLFATQPLLWGHAFINSKDIPLMVFFLGSIALGLKMADVFIEDKPVETSIGKNLSLIARQDWSATTRISWIAFVMLTAMIVVLLLAAKIIQNMVISLIALSYAADSTSLLGTLFASVADYSDGAPLDAYIHKGIVIYERGHLFVILLLLVLLLVLLVRSYRNTLVGLWLWLQSVWSKYLSRWVLLLFAAVFLGLAISTRVAGAFAWVLVASNFLIKGRIRSSPAIFTYTIVAIFVTYITWPYLWPDPVGNYIESLAVNSNFGWTGDVLFQGIRYKSNDLPASYLPVLLTLQFTEPVYILFCVGIIWVTIEMLKHRIKWQDILILFIWLFMPFFSVILFRPLMYDNFRHFLFIVPPIFILGGFALDKLFQLLKPVYTKIAVLLILIIPALYGGVKLHPYQYIYYNSLADGVRGAFRHYELDYWVTSYREATLFLNQEAPVNSQVLVVGPRRIFMSYAREDLNREWFTVEQLDETTDHVFVIISTRYDDDLNYFPNARTVYRVSRDGAVLAVVKQIQ